MTTDITEATFREEVLNASDDVPVVVDLWAPWCTPCLTLGPIIERVIDATDGAVRLAKVNIDENPRVANAFGVSSIPAVFAIHKGRVVDQFVGVRPEREVKQFVERLVPVKSEADLLAEKGDEESLRTALELEPDHRGAVLALASLLTEKGDADEALALLARIPESGEVRKAKALARLRAHSDNDGATAGPPAGGEPAWEIAPDGNVVAPAGAGGGSALEEHLDDLLTRVKDDEAARQELIDILETMELEDPRRAKYRKALAARLF